MLDGDQSSRVGVRRWVVLTTAFGDERQQQRMRDVAAALDRDGIGYELDESAGALILLLPPSSGRVVAAITAWVQEGRLHDRGGLPRHLPPILLRRALEDGETAATLRVAIERDRGWISAIADPLSGSWTTMGSDLVAALSRPGGTGSVDRAVLVGLCRGAVAAVGIVHGSTDAVACLCADLDDAELRSVLTAAAGVQPREYDATCRIRPDGHGSDYDIPTDPGSGRISVASARLAVAVAAAMRSNHDAIRRIAAVTAAMARERRTPGTLLPGIEYAWMDDSASEALGRLLVDAASGEDASRRVHAVGDVILAILSCRAIDFMEWRRLLGSVGDAIGEVVQSQSAALRPTSLGVSAAALALMQVGATLARDAAQGSRWPLNEIVTGAEKLTAWMSRREPADSSSEILVNLLLSQGAALLLDDANVKALRSEIEEWRGISRIQHGSLRWALEELWWRTSFLAAAGYGEADIEIIARPHIDEAVRSSSEQWRTLLDEGISDRVLSKLGPSQLLQISRALLYDLPYKGSDPEQARIGLEGIERLLHAAAAAGSDADLPSVYGVLIELRHYAEDVNGQTAEPAPLVTRAVQVVTRSLEAWSPRLGATQVPWLLAPYLTPRSPANEDLSPETRDRSVG